MEYIDSIKHALYNTHLDISKLDNDVLNMEGMTGRKTRHFYNNLLGIVPNPRYLEIGTWKGSSLCSAMYGNKANIVCIDNWSEFQGPKNEFIDNLEKYKGLNTVYVVEVDSWAVEVSKLPKFNIYLYDGAHKEEDHYKALMHYINCMDDIFIFIVDDWNWKNVRDGTFRAIKELNLETLYHHEIRLTNDDTHTPKDIAGKTWWNGIYICVLKKKT
jgi:hypothetical protein